MCSQRTIIVHLAGMPFDKKAIPVQPVVALPRYR